MVVPDCTKLRPFPHLVCGRSVELETKIVASPGSPLDPLQGITEPTKALALVDK